MSTQVNVEILVVHPRYVSDAVMLAKVSAPALDLSPELSFPGINQSIVADVTAISAPGTIRRTFSVVFTAEFLAAYTTDDAQLAAFTGLFRDLVRTQVPASDVTVNITPV